MVLFALVYVSVNVDSLINKEILPDSGKDFSDLKQLDFYQEMENLREKGIPLQTETKDTIELRASGALFVGNDQVTNLIDPEKNIEWNHFNQEGIQLLSNKVMTKKEWKEVNSNYTKLDEFDENRLIRVMEFYYPNVYWTKVGTYKNANVTAYYDAETGLFIGSEVKGDLVDFKGRPEV